MKLTSLDKGHAHPAGCIYQVAVYVARVLRDINVMFPYALSLLDSLCCQTSMATARLPHHWLLANTQSVTSHF